MVLAVPQGSPLATAVASVIPPKLVEMGWSTDDGQESALIEYIVLMLINGKNQEELATELTNDFLGSDEDMQALEFSKWLFGQVEVLNQQLNGTPNDTGEAAQPENGADAEMGGVGEGIPTGPKAMRNGRGRGNMINQINRNLDRSDSALHRVRGNQGNGRVGGGGRGQNQMKNGRYNNGRGGRMGNAGNMGMPGNMGMGMTPENQMQLFSMLEEQARMMAQFMPGLPPVINPAFQHGQQQSSLFNRVERPNHRGGGRLNKRGNNKNDNDTDMEMDESNPDNVCKFNLRCTRKDCPFAHQSPAAPEGTSVDPSDTCSFGAACKNKKCTARHPSPAVRSAHQAEEMCRFFPNCANPHCHFKHPSMPLCRNGADCTTEGCQFTHVQTACKFNPCMNPSCTYKHAEGQRGSIPDKVWKASHVSERKFVDNDDGPEELIKPETTDGSQNPELTA